MTQKRGGNEGPVFIIGFGRSGTTLLATTLANHPSIEIALENNLLYAIHKSAYEFDKQVQPQDLPLLLSHLECTHRRVGYFLKAPEQRVVIERLTVPVTPVDLYERLLRRNNESEIWGEKGLVNCFLSDRIEELYPGARFIHMVRDPRDVTISYYRKKLRKRIRAQGKADIPDDLIEESLPDPSGDWGFCAKYALRWQFWQGWIEAHRPSNYLLVQYENLVTSPEEVLQDCYRFLGVESIEGVPIISAEQYQISAEKPHQKNLAQPITNSYMHHYRDLHPDLIACIEYFSPSMRNYGYRPEFPHHAKWKNQFGKLRYIRLLSKDRKLLHAIP